MYIVVQSGARKFTIIIHTVHSIHTDKLSAGYSVAYGLIHHH